MFKIRLLLAIGFIIYSGIHLFASFENTTGGARMQAMAGAFVAVADDSQAVFVQPANYSSFSKVEVSLTYGRLFCGLSDGSNITNSIFSLGYPINDKVGLGFGYKNLSLDEYYIEEMLVTGIAYHFVDEVSAGINIKYLGIRYGGNGYTEIDPVFFDSNKKGGYDLDFGLIYKVLPILNIGYSRTNLLGIDLGLKSEYKLSSCDHIGVMYYEDLFKVTLETIEANCKRDFLVGLEKEFFKKLIDLRLGAGWNSSKVKKVTTGFGVNLSKVSLNYALDYPLSGIESTSGTHYISFISYIDKIKLLKKKPKAKAKEEKKSEIEKERKKKVKKKRKALSFSMVRVFKRNFSKQIYHPTLLYSINPIKALCTYEISKEIEVQEKESEVFEEEVISQPSISTPKPAKIKKDSEIKKKSKSKTTQRTHKVVRGDTLPSLAEKYYGDKSAWTKIFQANRENIEKGSLRPGQVLIIP